jgi:hypothetical protein
MPFVVTGFFLIAKRGFGYIRYPLQMEAAKTKLLYQLGWDKPGF